MILYRLRRRDTLVDSWVGTQAEAKARVKELENEETLIQLEGYPKFDQVDVPTDKAGLLDWLNLNY